MSEPRASTVRHRATLFAEADELIRLEYRSELRLHDVARRIATSPRALQRAFIEIGHTTFRDHVCAVRMDIAARLLRGTRLTVREVAGEVGYRQQAQFAKTFRRHTGMGPIEYRRGGVAPDRYAMLAA